MLSIEQLTEQIMLLSSSDRALLAERIIKSLNAEIDSATQAARLAEVKRRQDATKTEIVEVVPEESLEDEAAQFTAIAEDFRQAWHEAMTGKTIPVTQLWQELGDD